ncbi:MULTISPECIES: rod shape-determining protein [Dethiosulfovibrio]|uniref:Cell shape-determining protein MreB n=2 Tax=Dethiosulfovibrio TaxID=47054 RepID=A0ABS9EL74_9BACT|nr:MULTISPECIES: rod shape-determining protein [Dethiosulfovibrio]MCF4112980.1 rod shape-determining protein [Dethiosulfovibrio russensis]MCF4141444.1 rod shape-determining protein [Dethiosulfovibrio marinus]MCF4144400.1 rod shape-determining protein [Dethiosulfovibrio acidaminovorans]
MGFFSGFLGNDVGIDLGTSNVVVYQCGEGIVLDEPSAVAVRKRKRGGQAEVIAFGHEAKAMAGKTPAGVSTIRPLKDGVIANFDMTEAIIRHFLQLTGGAGIKSRPRVVISVPAKVTEVEKKAVIDATLGAGAREAYVVDEPIAAALGAGLPIQEPIGSMILDVGGGTSEVAVLSLGGIVVNNSLRVAGDDMDDAIIAMLRQKHAILIGETTAESVKMEIGSALPTGEEIEIEVKGRDLADGLPKVATVSSAEIREALDPLVSRVEDMVKVALEQTPPELSKDIVDQGIVLTGGVCQLRGLDQRLSRALNAPVILCDDPLHSVAQGVGKILEDLNAMKKVLMSVEKGSR